MSSQPDASREFERLSSEIDQAERALREHFTATPALEPAAMRRIKARLHGESLGLPSAQSGPAARWLRPLAATAATILLAATFYATMRPMASRPIYDSPMAGSGTSLETFTASLPAVLSDEDPEITQLQSELRQLESQTAGNTIDAAEPDDPAAQHSLPNDSASIAAAWLVVGDTGHWTS